MFIKVIKYGSGLGRGEDLTLVLIMDGIRAVAMSFLI